MSNIDKKNDSVLTPSQKREIENKINSRYHSNTDRILNQNAAQKAAWKEDDKEFFDNIDRILGMG